MGFTHKKKKKKNNNNNNNNNNNKNEAEPSHVATYHLTTKGHLSCILVTLMVNFFSKIDNFVVPLREHLSKIL